jgi:3-ketosteroid 9alpha-monooxygenase subunit A
MLQQQYHEKFGSVGEGYPTGWFQIAWSDDVGPGEVKPLHYFDQDLVVFRTESGKVAVLNAHCLHMGGHLAFGGSRSPRRSGSVVGECIECPWHGWQWDTNGCNALIPYSKRPNSAQRIPSWPVREIYGMILLWHDQAGSAPGWEPRQIPEFESDDYHPVDPHGARQVWRDRHVQPQFVAENHVDIAHVKFVHGAEDVAYDAHVEVDGPCVLSSWKILYSTNRRGGEGERQPIEGTFRGEIWGVGIIINRMYGIRDNLNLIGVTPINPEHSDIFMTNIVMKGSPDEVEPDVIGKKMLHNQLDELESDLPTWENMRFVPRPPYPPEESSAFRKLRAHLRQFYPG